MKLLRPHQYVKNGFVLVGPLFAQQRDAATLANVGLAFTAFCLMASAVYILNDLIDVAADREHPIKRERPLPSGQISMAAARLLLGLLVVGAIVISMLVGLWVTFFVVCYFLMNIAYSWKLKHIVILDVFVISIGFMLRILVGTIGLAIAPSSWLLLCGMMVTLFLGFAKRRAELLMLEGVSIQNDNLTRKVLADYSPALLDQLITATATSTILTYGLYTVSPSTIALHGSEALIYTLPFVMYGIFRYLFLLNHRTKGNDTARDLVTDAHLLITALGWVIATIWVLSF